MFVATIGTPQTPAVGEIRFNTTTNQMELYTGNGWAVITAGMRMNEKKIVCEDLTFGSLTFYKVITEGYDFDELNEWCNQTFGPPRTGPDTNNTHKWFLSSGEFYFHEEKYREWFVLKWSA